jgi:cytochrome c oxidase cbb3-type subunit II
MNFSILERNTPLLLIAVLITVSIGGIAQIVPLFTIPSIIERVEGMRPYTPLELLGRNIYIREGCYLCHSQHIRTLRDEVERYGHYSLAAESMYDHPFQWGSKRTGPDLARVGGKYSNEWHALHLDDPRALVPESVMPPFRFLRRPLPYGDVVEHLKANRAVGVPYSDAMIANAKADLEIQAGLQATSGAPGAPGPDAAGLNARYAKAPVGDFDGDPKGITEMDALIAYLQMLGTLVDTTNLPLDKLRQ